MNNQSIILDILENDAFFSNPSITTRKIYGYDEIVTLSKCVYYHININKLKKDMMNVEFLDAMHNHSQMMLYRAQERIRLLNIPHIRERIEYFLKFFSVPGENNSLSISGSSKTEIAIFCNTTRPTASKIFMDLKKENLIKEKGKDIFLTEKFLNKKD